MIKIYGHSDDCLEIYGSKYYEDEIGCFDRDVIITFEDGTVIRAGYCKPNLAVWYIYVIKEGTAEYRLTICRDQDADIYSDIFEIDSEIVSHQIVRQEV